MEEKTVELNLEEKQYSLGKDAWNRLIANKLAIIGLVIVFALFFIAIFGPLITPYDFLSQDLQARNQAPSMQHWFGTDDLGRDILSRVIYGAQNRSDRCVFNNPAEYVYRADYGISIAGYFGGKVDSFITWLIDVIMSIPSLLLVIVINVSLKAEAG